MTKLRSTAEPRPIQHPFDRLAHALQMPDLGIYCPGGKCSIVDGDAVAEFGDRVLGVLSGAAYNIGTLLPRTSLPHIELARMVETGRYRLPHPICAVHFDCPYGNEVLNEVMVLEQLGDQIGVTMFTSVENDWNLIPLTLMIDPGDLPFEDDHGSADCFELEGFDVAVTDLEGLDEAMSIQTEFLHRVIEAIAPNKPRLN
ncbi:MAG TPA: hypothetical protein VGB82_23345 [Alphaproteobacteria bacterium]